MMPVYIIIISHSNPLQIQAQNPQSHTYGCCKDNKVLPPEKTTNTLAGSHLSQGASFFLLIHVSLNSKAPFFLLIYVKIVFLETVILFHTGSF